MPLAVTNFNLGRQPARRERKSTGATYTPQALAKFVARQIVDAYVLPREKQAIRILDPAAGDGELLVSLVTELQEKYPGISLVCDAFDTNAEELKLARARLDELDAKLTSDFRSSDFLEHVVLNGGIKNDLLHDASTHSQYDLIIANPPYVRTQVMGAERARSIAQTFSLQGRVDLYYAFLMGISVSLASNGIAGVIVSNRFMTTKSGSSVRRELLSRFDIQHIWDFGDTKLFDAAVLPAVLILGDKSRHPSPNAKLSSIYRSEGEPTNKASSPISALQHNGIVEVADGRLFHVKHGLLNSSSDSEVWSLNTEEGRSFLAAVNAAAWGTFADIGKIRVGVKTCADKVFIRENWSDIGQQRMPELLRPLSTHHIARRFRAKSAASTTQILYPHEVINGKRQAVDLSQYPLAKRYLEANKSALQRRTYVTEAGREWYEIWVPQDPDAWSSPKIVFRDIAERPTFWIDLNGSIVNGDCYWLKAKSKDQEHLLWLALCVANSNFIEAFYDLKFNNKLYAGRRRFITQYVERFPIPDPTRSISRKMIEMAKTIYSADRYDETNDLQSQLNNLVWECFGLSEKILG